MNWYGKDIIENAATSVVLEHSVGFPETNNMSNMEFLGPSVSFTGKSVRNLRGKREESAQRLQAR